MKLWSLGLALLASCSSIDRAPEGAPAMSPGTWPMGPGPRGDWTADPGPPPPLHFSAASGEHIAWRTPLPETGQGGIAVVGDRLFVATMAPWDEDNALSRADAQLYSHAIEKRKVVGKHIDGHCVDRATGRILWSRRIEGTVPSIYSYPFSDATSASPVATESHVWFTNGGGRLVCFTRDGDEVWARDFVPTYDGPFNKQFEPLLVRDGERLVLIHMEPVEVDGGPGRWNKLIGLDALTGKALWVSDDALTHYNAPTLVQRGAGTACLIARGGPHKVPERPVGMSLVSVTGADAGRSIWRYDDPRGNHEAALNVMAHDGEVAFWILKGPRNLVEVIDLETGEVRAEISLTEAVEVSRLLRIGRGNSETVTLEENVHPARYTAIARDGQLFFQCYATSWGKDTIGPPYSFARITAATGRVEYLEVPTEVNWGKVLDPYIYRAPRPARAINSRGVEVTGDDRSRWAGWDWVFNGAPTLAGDHIWFTLASGLVYTIPASSPNFGGDGIWLSDLGPTGETWTANSASIVDGRIFHRTAAELLCIEDDGVVRVP